MPKVKEPQVAMQDIEAAARAMGGRVTTVEEFLGETPTESAYIEMSLRLADALRAARVMRGVSQKSLAAQLGTKQPAIARLEGGTGGAAMDALTRALLALGATPDQIGGVMGGSIKPEDVIAKDGSHS